MRVTHGLIVVALAFVPVGAATLAAVGPIKAPRSGEYSGLTDDGGDVTVSIVGKQVESVSFEFDCHRTVGRTTLQDFELVRDRHGYRFRIKAFGSITYDDEEVGENAPVLIVGTFTPRARQVSGLLRVRAERCETGKVEWTARRVTGGS